ncbi:MAG: segregation/condensation protein A [bacterium]
MTTETGYQIETDVYQGPFDLLLKAIDNNEIDVHNISISQIVVSYLNYWQSQKPELVVASDFIYMAAYLIELKSKSLLPAKEEYLPDDNLLAVEESLVSHLEEYAIFKGLARTLKERKDVYERVFGRHEGEAQEHEFELVDVSLKDLVQAFKRAYDQAAKRERVVSIKAEEITLEDRIEEVKKLLGERTEGLPFEDLFIRRTRIEIVVTFLAILELTKQRMIRIVQGDRFGSIMIIKRKEENQNNG